MPYFTHTEIRQEAEAALTPDVVRRYFGYATFKEYYAATSKMGHCNEKKTIDQAWQSVMRKLGSGVHIRAAEWIRDELKRNPRFRTRPVWYFLMPEARATLDKDLLSAVDASGAGVGGSDDSKF
jgi:hypothetical protein